MEKIPALPNINPEQLELPSIDKLAPVGDLTHPPRILMLYGSLRERSFSRFLTYEAARILEHFGAEVKIFDPMELPMVGSVPDTHWSSCARCRCGPKGRCGAVPSAMARSRG
jgi:arsenical resistance protein ArsH